MAVTVLKSRGRSILINSVLAFVQIYLNYEPQNKIYDLMNSGFENDQIR